MSQSVRLYTHHGIAPLKIYCLPREHSRRSLCWHYHCRHVSNLRYSHQYLPIHSFASLFGITNLQMLIYYKRYPDDLRIYRYSVCWCSFWTVLRLLAEDDDPGSNTLVCLSHSCQGITTCIDRVLDAFHVALSTHMLYFYMVDMYGDLVGALGYPVWCVLGQTPNVNFIEVLL